MHSKPDIVKKIALERMERLFELASEKEASGSDDDNRLARRYTTLLKKIGMHYKVQLPKRIKNSICSGCGAVLIPGKNCTVRMASSEGYAVYKCECGKEKHIFYRRG